VFSTCVITAVYYVFSKFMCINSWSMVLITIIICGFVGIFINYLVLFNKSDRDRVKEIIRNKLQRERK